MSVITNNTIQPSSGQALTIKDEGGTASITVATNGEATFAENIIIGTAGNGITFQDETNDASATISNQANTLDSYEIGYWEPAIKSSAITSGTLTIASSTPKLTYVRIGPLVFISGRLEFSASSPQGDLFIENLPFLIADLQSSDSIKNHPSISVHFTNLASEASNQSVGVYIPPGNAIRIRDNINSTSGGSAFSPHINSSTQLYIGGCYYTT